MAGTMQKVGIAIDPWKLPIFECHLTQAGCIFQNTGKLYQGALLLRVDTKNLEALEQILMAAHTEAARTGKPK